LAAGPPIFSAAPWRGTVERRQFARELSAIRHERYWDEYEKVCPRLSNAIDDPVNGEARFRAGICSVSQGIARHAIDSAAIEVKLRKLFSL
jgi:hypothetical protein